MATKKKAKRKPKKKTKAAKKKKVVWAPEARPGDGLWISYEDLDEIAFAPRNAKNHDVGLLTQSYDRFGFVEPPTRNETTGRLVAGHGRIEGLRAQKRAGDKRPKHVRPGPAGRWLVPIVCGNAFATDQEAEAYLLASNRTTQIGGYDDAGLVDMLKDHAELNDGLLGTGYDLEDLDFLRNRLDEDLGGAGSEEAGLSENYSRKIKAPIYTPKGDRPPVRDLFDRTKTEELHAEIDAQDLPAEVAGFPKEAAERHTVFRFDRIAEYYCHATPEVQDLMERSALVIIDFDKAIECGFVSLVTGMMEQAEIAKREKEAAELDA